LEEKEKHVAELDAKLKKRKENLDLLESQINKVGSHHLRNDYEFYKGNILFRENHKPEIAMY